MPAKLQYETRTGMSPNKNFRFERQFQQSIFNSFLFAPFHNNFAHPTPPFIPTRFGPNRVAADTEGNGEFFALLCTFDLTGRHITRTLQSPSSSP